PSPEWRRFEESRRTTPRQANAVRFRAVAPYFGGHRGHSKAGRRRLREPQFLCSPCRIDGEPCMAKLDKYRSGAAKCEEMAACTHPEVAALWHTMAESYRFLAKLESDHRPIWLEPDDDAPPFFQDEKLHEKEVTPRAT